MANPAIDNYDPQRTGPNSAYGQQRQYESPITGAYDYARKAVKQDTPYSPNWQERQGVRQQDLLDFKKELYKPVEYQFKPEYQENGRTRKSSLRYNEALLEGMRQERANFNNTLAGAFNTTATLEGQRAAERQKYMDNLSSGLNTATQGFMTGTSFARRDDMQAQEAEKRRQQERAIKNAELLGTSYTAAKAYQEAIGGAVPTPPLIQIGPNGQVFDAARTTPQSLAARQAGVTPTTAGVVSAPGPSVEFAPNMLGSAPAEAAPMSPIADPATANGFAIAQAAIDANNRMKREKAKERIAGLGGGEIDQARAGGYSEADIAALEQRVKNQLAQNLNVSGWLNDGDYFKPSFNDVPLKDILGQYAGERSFFENAANYFLDKPSFGDTTINAGPGSAERFANLRDVLGENDYEILRRLGYLDAAERRSKEKEDWRGQQPLGGLVPDWYHNMMAAAPDFYQNSIAPLFSPSTNNAATQQADAMPEWLKSLLIQQSSIPSSLD